MHGFRLMSIAPRRQTNKQEKMQNVNQICEISLPKIMQNCEIVFLLQKECWEQVR